MKNYNPAVRFVLAVFSAVLALSLLFGCSADQRVYEIVGVDIYNASDTVTWRATTFGHGKVDIGRHVSKTIHSTDTITLKGVKYIGKHARESKTYRVVAGREVTHGDN